MEGQISSRVILKHFFTPKSKAVSYTKSLKYHKGSICKNFRTW